MNLGYIGNLAHQLRLVRELPPRLVWAKVRKRLPWTDKARVRIDEVLHDPSQMRAGRMREFLDGNEALLESEIGWPRLDFNGRRVLEIGPGPLGGWGPLAIFRGAESYHGVDPDWIDGTLADRRIETGYLRPVLDDLAAHFGGTMDFASFRESLARRLHIARGALDVASLPDAAEIVLSNSCLEHIADLDRSISALARLMAPSARFLHLVNFGNHRDKDWPFTRIYDMPPRQYRLRFGPHINLARPSDVMAGFAKAGLNSVLVPVDRRPDLVEAVHPYWSERYDRDELAIRTALVVSGG
ncbi:MAG: hypothetical protein QF654_14660 [Alphaproteobacteria bacterium]|nr:hypothetical protein [Alphaproteobacteria bacterium]